MVGHGSITVSDMSGLAGILKFSLCVSNSVNGIPLNSKEEHPSVLTTYSPCPYAVHTCMLPMLQFILIIFRIVGPVGLNDMDSIQHSSISAPMAYM